LKKNIRVIVEKLFSIKAAEYLQEESDQKDSYRYDILRNIFEVYTEGDYRGYSGVNVNVKRTEKNILSVIEAGYLAPLTDLKGDLTAPAKRYRILRFEEDCAKVCTTPPVSTLSAEVESQYYSDGDNLTYKGYSSLNGFYEAYDRKLGYVWAHQDEYLLIKVNKESFFLPKALLPHQAKLVALAYMEILLDKITSKEKMKHTATLSLFADIHEVIAASLRAEVAGTLTHGYKHGHMLPIVLNKAPLLLKSPVGRVRQAAQWLLEHPECSSWDYVKDIWPEPKKEEE
jgi:hypothetical protein